MTTTVDEAREYRAVLVEAFNPLHGIRAGNVVGQEAAQAAGQAIRPLNRLDAVLAAIERGEGPPDPAQLRLDTMTTAVRLLCHDLRAGATVLIQTANLIERYAERGDFDRAAARSRTLVALVRQRVAAIEAGEAKALGVGDGSAEQATACGPGAAGGRQVQPGDR